MKPMLAVNYDPSKLRFPVLASPKLDGVRALKMDGKVLSRTLKPIANLYVQQILAELPDGLDGELICGDPTDPKAFRKTTSAVNSRDGHPNVVFWVFDSFTASGGFTDRYNSIKQYGDRRHVMIVEQVLISNADELLAYEEKIVGQGYEGVMLRTLDGPYKHGRSTLNEGYLLKVKRFEDAEAVVESVTAWQRNDNESRTNALGHSEKSSHKDNKVDLPILGKLNVRGINGTYKGVEFGIGTGFDGADSPTGERAKLWADRYKLIGKIVTYRYFPLGSKDAPRFPVFHGFRDAADLD